MKCLDYYTLRECGVKDRIEPNRRRSALVPLRKVTLIVSVVEAILVYDGRGFKARISTTLLFVVDGDGELGPVALWHNAVGDVG